MVCEYFQWLSMIFLLLVWTRKILTERKKNSQRNDLLTSQNWVLFLHGVVQKVYNLEKWS